MVGKVNTSLNWLTAVEADRRAAGLRRELRPRTVDSPLIDLASNDYLGLVRHPDVIEGATAALRRWGAGATGSRLVTGTTTEHELLEVELAEFVGADSGLVFSSGYTANLGAVTALSGPGALIVSDAGSHASLVDACRLSRARVAVAPHSDVGFPRRHVAQQSGRASAGRHGFGLQRRRRPRAAAGDASGVPRVRGDPAGRRGAWHRCARCRWTVDSYTSRAWRVEPDVVVTATLSKSLASQGGVVLGDNKIRAHLIDAARTFIFDTGLAPAAVGAARAALAVLQREPTRALDVLARASELADVTGAPVA